MKEFLFDLPPADLPPSLADRLKTAPDELRAMVIQAPAHCRGRLVEFAERWAPGSDGPRILGAYVDHTRQRVSERPCCRLSSDRFGHGVPYAERLEITNNLIPLFVASVAIAAPDLANNIFVGTHAAKALMKANWRPSAA